MSAPAGANGGPKKGPVAQPKPAAGKPDKGKKKEEAIALGVGAVVGTGIVWSLFRSLMPKKSEVEVSQELGGLEVSVGLGEGEGELASLSLSVPDLGGSTDPGYTALAPPKKGVKSFKFKATKIYEISNGDTLWSLAGKFNTTVDALKSVNGLTSDNIVAGDTITVPK